MRTRTILLAAVFATACTVQNNSALLISEVLPPTKVTHTSTDNPPIVTSTCEFDAAAKEVSFLPINLTENDGNVFVTVVNGIQATNSANSLNVDASVFLPHQAVITYQFLGTGDGNPPANVTVAHSPVIVPVDGAPITGGGAAQTVAVPIIPRNTIAGAPDLSFIRATFHIEGKLLGGSTVHTSEREYLFQVCAAAGCAQNTCL